MRKLVSIINDQMKSFVIQGTVFWLIVSGITSPLLTYFPGSQYVFVGVVFMIIHFVIAYFSWKQKQWSYVIAILLALFIIVTDVVISGLQYTGDELLVILQTLVFFFSYRSYIEVS